MRFPNHVCLAWKWLGNHEENAIFFDWDEEMVFYSQKMELENRIFCPLCQYHVQMEVGTCEFYFYSWMSLLCSKEVVVKHCSNIRNPPMLVLPLMGLKYATAQKIEQLCKFKSVWNFMIIQQNVVCFTGSARDKIEVMCENMHTNQN